MILHQKKKKMKMYIRLTEHLLKCCVKMHSVPVFNPGENP